jgi:hypothetical protein
MKFFFKNILWVVPMALLFTGSGCRVYSLNGISLSPDVKTISIQNFTNETGLGPARLSQNFTEKVKEYFLQNSNLKLVKIDGDLQLQGGITGYALIPVGAQSTGTVQQGQSNRLQITVKVKFENTKDESQDYTKDFSFYGDFPPNQSLSSVENQKIDEITDQIVLDIFNASVANW